MREDELPACGWDAGHGPLAHPWELLEEETITAVSRGPRTRSPGKQDKNNHCNAPFQLSCLLSLRGLCFLPGGHPGLHPPFPNFPLGRLWGGGTTTSQRGGTAGPASCLCPLLSPPPSLPPPSSSGAGSTTLVLTDKWGIPVCAGHPTAPAPALTPDVHTRAP